VTQTLHARSDGEFEPDAYSARHLLVLEGLEAVRKRPGMYIGSTDSRGLMHCLWEIIDNSVDEALGGHCSLIEIELHADGSVEVRDNGRGIPVDVEPRTGLAGVEVVMTRLHAGGKFGGSSYAATGGLHGVGASVVNALSVRLDVEVDRDAKTHAISFRRGVPGEFSNGKPDGPFVGKSGMRIVGKVTKKTTGTRVRYWADRQIFAKDAGLSIDELHNRARQTAFVSLRRRDKRILRVPRTRSDHLRRAAAAGCRSVQGDSAGPRRPGAHDLDRGRARADGRRRGAVGHRL
jgi:DNA gyrase subunit B